MSNLIMRPIAGPEEVERFNELPYVLNEEFGGDVGEGRRRPEWMWMALRGVMAAHRDRINGKIQKNANSGRAVGLFFI